MSQLKIYYTNLNNFYYPETIYLRGVQAIKSYYYLLHSKKICFDSLRYIVISWYDYINQDGNYLSEKFETKNYLKHIEYLSENIINSDLIDFDKKILKISELTEEQKEILKSMVYLEKGLFIRELNL